MIGRMGSLKTRFRVPTKEQSRGRDRTIENILRELNGYTVSECEWILQAVSYHVREASTVRVEGYIVEGYGGKTA